MASYSSFALAILRSPGVVVLNDAEYEIFYVDQHKFSIIAHQPLIDSSQRISSEISYSIETTHPLGGFIVKPQELAGAISNGFPVILTLLSNRKSHAAIGTPDIAHQFDFVDFIESVTLADVTISIQHRHELEPELGIDPGYSLNIRRNRNHQRFAIPIDVITNAAQKSEMIFSHAFAYAPEAAKQVSEWLSHIPYLSAAHESDVDRFAFESLPNGIQGKNKKGPL